MLGEVTHLQTISDDLRSLTSDPHKLPPASEQVRENVEDKMVPEQSNKVFLHLCIKRQFAQLSPTILFIPWCFVIVSHVVFLPLRWSWTWRAQTTIGHIRLRPRLPAPLFPGSLACAGWFWQSNTDTPTVSLPRQKASHSKIRDCNTAHTVKSYRVYLKSADLFFEPNHWFWILLGEELTLVWRAGEVGHRMEETLYCVAQATCATQWWI